MANRILFMLAVIFTPNSALASFIDLWLTADQQGRYYFERGDYQRGARAFENRQWKAIAFYRAGDFANAAARFEKLDSPEGYFNLGNALAKQEKLEPAVAAYRRALELRPNFPEASFNLEWVQGLLDLDNKTYEDAGGTGGKLGADKIVFDERGAKGQGEMTAREAQAQQGLSDDELRDMWMRRVQTTPGDFLRYKFSYQLRLNSTAESEPEGGTR